MVHPHSHNCVSVGLESPPAASDDGGIAAIRSDSGEKCRHIFPHGGGILKDQGEAVLPQIPPASPAPSVIVMRQERTAVDSS